MLLEQSIFQMRLIMFYMRTDLIKLTSILNRYNTIIDCHRYCQFAKRSTIHSLVVLTGHIMSCTIPINPLSSRTISATVNYRCFSFTHRSCNSVTRFGCTYHRNRASSLSDGSNKNKVFLKNFRK